MSMTRSPNKKAKRWPVRPKSYKTGVSGNKGGISGSRHSKRHDRAAEAPGKQRGVCISAKGETCRCGGCNAKKEMP